MGLLSAITRLSKELRAAVVSDGVNVLGTAANPFHTTPVSDSTIDAAAIAASVSAAVAPSPPLMHLVTLPSGANADVDVVLTFAERIVDVMVVLKGAGTAGCLVTVKNTATAISDAINVAAGGDKAVFRATTMDDAQDNIAAAGTLRVSYVSTGGDFPGAEVYITALRV